MKRTTFTLPLVVPESKTQKVKGYYERYDGTPLSEEYRTRHPGIAK